MVLFSFFSLNMIWEITELIWYDWIELNWFELIFLLFFPSFIYKFFFLQLQLIQQKWKRWKKNYQILKMKTTYSVNMIATNLNWRMSKSVFALNKIELTSTHSKNWIKTNIVEVITGRRSTKWEARERWNKNIQIKCKSIQILFCVQMSFRHQFISNGVTRLHNFNLLLEMWKWKLPMAKCFRIAMHCE